MFFLVSWTVYYKMHILFLKNVDDFEIEHKDANLGVGSALPPLKLPDGFHLVMFVNSYLKVHSMRTTWRLLIRKTSQFILLKRAL